MSFTSHIIEEDLGKDSLLISCYADQASSHLHCVVLALQVSLPSPSQLLPFNHLRTKPEGGGLVGTAQLISSAYSVKKCIPTSRNLAPYFLLHISHFHLQLLSILIINSTNTSPTDSFKMWMLLTMNCLFEIQNRMVFFNLQCFWFFWSYKPFPYLTLVFLRVQKVFQQAVQTKQDIQG